MFDNPKLDVIIINAHVKFGQIHSFIFKILSGNEILTSFKDRYSVTNYRKWKLNNPNKDVLNINASAKFYQNQILRSQDIERIQNSDVIQGP